MSPALVGLAALALSAVSTSKVGVVVLGDDTTSQALLASCPRLAVFRLTSTSQAQELQPTISGYRSGCSGARVVVQVGDRGMQVDGNTVTEKWTSLWLPEILAAGTVDAVEGPSDPVPVTPNSTTEVPAFWSSFVAQAAGLGGVTPVVGATGVPAGLGTASDEFCATVAAVASGNWAWSYHARSPTMGTDSTTESATTLAYRKIVADCPELAGKTLYVTEAGRASGAWRVTPAPSDLDWIAFFDEQLQLDGAEVIGAALLQAGMASNPFDLTPIASSLSSYLQNPAPADGGTPDAGTDGGSPGGVVTPGNGGPGGTLVPSKTSGCSAGGSMIAALALLPALLLLRRWRR